MQPYTITVKVNLPFAAALVRTREALATQGFGIITEIDVKQTMKQKIGAEMRPYVILGACMPEVAYRAIEAEPQIGALMPCNVCVWDNDDGTSTVAAVDVKLIFQMVQNPALSDVAGQVDSKLRTAIATVRAAA